MTHLLTSSETNDHKFEYGDTFHCGDCGEDKPVFSDPNSTMFPEYGHMPDSEKLTCWACCGLADAKQMREVGKITLYYANNKIVNWPGTLKFDVIWAHKGNHNIGGTQVRGRFKDMDGKLWRFTHTGHNHQIARCYRLKEAK